jgi:hypothetical protein
MTLSTALLIGAFVLFTAVISWLFSSITGREWIATAPVVCLFLATLAALHLFFLRRAFLPACECNTPHKKSKIIGAAREHGFGPGILFECTCGRRYVLCENLCLSIRNGAPQPYKIKKSHYRWILDQPPLTSR